MAIPWAQSNHLRLGLLAVFLLVSFWLFWPSNPADTVTVFQSPSEPEQPEQLPPTAEPDSAVATAPAPPTQLPKDRPLILYAYAESAVARENIQYFAAKGLHGAADFIFIFNGETNATEFVPSADNIRIVRRPNTCFDLGAIGEVLREGDLWRNYKRFITMNASIRGPFLPIWSSGCWSDLYLDRVTDTNKLVGMTVNCQPRPHVQSMIFATDDVGMGILLDPSRATSASVDDDFGTHNDPVGLSHCYAGWKEAVHAEVGTTGLITGAGFTVDAMMTSLHSEDGVSEYCRLNPSSGDLLFDKKYFGSNIHPYETIFIKANRDIDHTLVNSLTKWHLKQKTTSYELCGR
ncbi:hypothetical protein OQA88_5985 [Cercophora sp. LCS_1]